MSPTMNKVLSWLDNVDLPSSPEKTGDASNLELDHYKTESPSVYARPPSDIGRVSDKSDADILEDGLDPIWPEVFGSQPFDQRNANILEGTIDSVWPEVGWPVLYVTQEDVVRDDASHRAEAASKQKDVEQGRIVMDTTQDRKISHEGKSAKDEANDAVDDSDASQRAEEASE
ncbi:uncharacterized protein N7515_009416 [Penicillium bovifimosum]|uniref:Uncharacterized protein n=1 Tax=Penicillium bovifimosum TaxID=126998 RepID=A0A9W9GJ85_9EURO|nr:uncharacterized protein N7515_009416 [Penicillium bovifimosum]KAJ5121455.1 hypothetical protein N7515_009416 [Penicillium bovifimosum]